MIYLSSSSVYIPIFCHKYWQLEGKENKEGKVWKGREKEREGEGDKEKGEDGVATVL